MRKQACLQSLALVAALVFTGCATQQPTAAEPVQAPRVFKMPNRAMMPTIQPGELVVADVAAYAQRDPSRWDLVVFRAPHDSERIWAFRVVGLPGEKICFEDGKPVVDGERLDTPDALEDVHYEPFAADGAGGMDSYAYEIPENEYYVLGDNAPRANDSRVWGSVSKDLILGRIADR